MVISHRESSHQLSRLHVIAVAVVLLCASVLAAQSSSTPISLPSHQWLALPLPATAAKGGLPGSLKHVSPGYNPVDHRFYFTAGDYSGSTASSSYRQETWSLSLKERLADPSNPIAGWRLEVPYCSGGLQPKWPDYGGFHWDASRNLFWWVAGVSEVNTSSPCAGETAAKTDEALYSFGHVMTYTPATKVWANAGALGPAFTKIWDTVYDAGSDTLVDVRQGSSAGDVYVDSFSPKTSTWMKQHIFAQPAIAKTLYGMKGYGAVDPATRTLYYIDVPYAHLMALNLATFALSDLGSVPPVALIKTQDQPKVVWDSTHKLLYWHNHAPGEFFAYHPDTRQWETLSTASSVSGIEACNAMVMAYDPDQDALIAWGDVWSDPGTCQANARPYLFVYRYGTQTVPTQPPTPPPPADSTVISLTASPDSVTAGQPTTLTTKVQVQGPTGPVVLTHDDVVTPSGTQDFSASLLGETASVTVTVTRPTLPPSLPSGLDAIAPGTWYQVPNSALDDAGIYPSPKPLGNLTSRAVMDAWSGGAYDSTRDRLLVHGGGHGDYAGNEIYAFSIRDLTWSRIWGPTPNNQIPPQPATADETYTNGDPRAVHSYAGLIYLPKQDRLWRHGGSLWSGSGGFSSATWTFDLVKGAWERQADLAGAYIPNAAYDPQTGHIFLEKYNFLWDYDPAADTYTKRSKQSAGYSPTGGAVIDQRTRQFIFWGDGKLYSYQLDTYPTSLVIRTTTGATEVQAGRPALAWDDDAQAIVGWNGGTAVYTLDTRAWTWTKHDADPANTVTPDAPNSAGTFGRFQYLPSHHCFALVNRTSGSVYVFKVKM